MSQYTVVACVALCQITKLSDYSIHVPHDTPPSESLCVKGTYCTKRVVFQVLHAIASQAVSLLPFQATKPAADLSCSCSVHFTHSLFFPLDVVLHPWLCLNGGFTGAEFIDDEDG